jgi:DNA polymerase elongation subunit (family B)
LRIVLVDGPEQRRDILGLLYLIDSQLEGNTIKLSFYDTSSEKMREFRDSDYAPYFLIPSPLSEKDEYTVERIVGNVSQVRRKDLFTNATKSLARVEIRTPTNIERFSKMFEKAWESEISFSQGYIYDHDLSFGTPHLLQGKQFTPVCPIPEETKTKFQQIFAGIEQTDPSKYRMLAYWFNLLYQRIPQVPPGILGMEGETASEKYYRTFMLSRIANLPIPQAYSSRRVSEWIKSMIYMYLRRNRILVPTSKELRRGTQLKRSVPGALTITPKSGIYFNTVVTDFESLYPSCIDSYNLSYETVNCAHKECAANTIPELEHHVCTKRRGFYSILVGALKDLRIHWFKPLSKDPTLSQEDRLIAETAAKLLKLITVSSYGVTVRIHGLASTALAESITGHGRYALQTAWNMAEERNLRPIYGDTDSIFLDHPPKAGVDWLIQTVKERLRLDLAVEKTYPMCVLSEAKKAYFGILADGTPDIKGLTVIKSNAPNFIQKVFRDCVNELRNVRNERAFEAAKQRIAAVVQDAIRNLRERRINLKDLEFSVRLYFDPRQKLAAEGPLPQPYQCAVQLIDSGKGVGKRDTVSFVKVTPFNYQGKRFTVKPADHVGSTSEINVEDYIRNLKTALDQSFSPMNITFEADKNMTIDKWFGAKD